MGMTVTVDGGRERKKEREREKENDLAIWPQSGPFRGVFWMPVGRFSTFGSKTHFPDNQTS